MAHEMAHVRCNHLYRMIDNKNKCKSLNWQGCLLQLLLGVINPTLGTGAMLGTMDSFEKDTINFIRSNEKEADSIGIDILTRAQYNPEGMPISLKNANEFQILLYRNVPLF